MPDDLRIVPARVEEYPVLQSQHEHLPKCPMRCYLYGPSGSGKTVLLQNMITRLYRTKSGKSCFTRVFVFSPTVHVDPQWHSVKKFAIEELGTPPDQECFFDHFDDKDVEKVLSEQKAIVEKVKEYKRRKEWKGAFPQVLVCLDDLLDDQHAMRNSKLLWELSARGRHALVNLIVASQYVRGAHPILRSNVTSWICFQPRNEKEAQAIAEEHSAAYGLNKTKNILRAATKLPHGFLYINSTAPIGQRFWRNFEEAIG